MTRTLSVGLPVSAALLLFAAVFVPSAILAAGGVIATALVAASIYGRSTGRWSAVWIAGVASVVWIASSVYTVDVWGQGYALSDDFHPVPAGLSIALAVGFWVGVAAFATVLATPIIAAIRARPSRGPLTPAGPLG